MGHNPKPKKRCAFVETSLRRYLDADCFRVVCADTHEEQDAILREKFDYIFFTGSPKVGRKIMVWREQLNRD